MRRIFLAAVLAVTILGPASYAYATNNRMRPATRASARVRRPTCPAGAVPTKVAARDARAVRFGPLRNPYGAGIFGVATGGGIQVESRSHAGRDLGSYAEAGARWVRIDINWASIQAAGRRRFAWAATDRIVRTAERCGMSVLGVLVYSPAWARPAGTDATYAPAPAPFARFAAVAARHYGRLGVHAFEIWNEPNLSSFWGPRANAGAYTALLRAAYPTIKAANPGATVITGGLAPSPSDGSDIAPLQFLRRLYADGGGGSFDAVGWHAYCWPAYPGARYAWSAWYQMYGTRTSVRSLMIRHGDGGKQIWATEFGAPTNGPPNTHVSERAQAAMILRAYRLWASYPWAGPLFTYSGRDQGTNPADNYDFYGILSFDYGAKPAYMAYWRASHSLVALAARAH